MPLFNTGLYRLTTKKTVWASWDHNIEVLQIPTLGTRYDFQHSKLKTSSNAQNSSPAQKLSVAVDYSFFTLLVSASSLTCPHLIHLHSLHLWVCKHTYTLYLYPVPCSMWNKNNASCWREIKITPYLFCSFPGSMIELQFCGSHNTITVSFPMFGMKRNQTPAPTVLEMDSISHFSALDPTTGSVRARNASYQPTVSLSEWLATRPPCG